MKKIGPKPQFNWEQIKEFCESLTDEEDSLTREMVACIADKWSLWTMSVIVEYRRPMRFCIMENIETISQKSLTKTLRGLERDGLITRSVFPTVPVTVQYALTDLGTSLGDAVAGIRAWAYTNMDAIDQARTTYDTTERTPISTLNRH